MRKNTVEPDRPQMTIWRMCFACWVIKATNTHSGYLLLVLFYGNNGFVSDLPCYDNTHIACLFTLWHNMDTLVSEAR